MTALTRRETSIIHRRVSGRCSRCGVDSTDGASIYRAAVLDADQQYHPKLCKECADGIDLFGTFAPLSTPKQQYLNALLKAMPEEYEEAIAEEMATFRG